MFRAIISPILRNTRLCLQLVVQCTGAAAWRQHLRCITPQAIQEGGWVTAKHTYLCILFIMLTATCFGQCGPSSGNKNI